MADKDKRSKKEIELQQHLGELTADLQRVQADFVNYRRRVEEERKNLSEMAKAATIMKLLPMIDDVERAIAHIPPELSDNAWAKGVGSLGKKLQNTLLELGLQRIASNPGEPFDPNLHEAVAMDDGEGDREVISKELRVGYQFGRQVVRPAMVKVTRQDVPETEPAQHAEEIIRDTKATEQTIKPEDEVKGED